MGISRAPVKDNRSCPVAFLRSIFPVGCPLQTSSPDNRFLADRLRHNPRAARFDLWYEKHLCVDYSFNGR